MELYRGGRVPLEKFAAMPYDRDILVRLWVKKDGRRAAYGSQRNTATDFPVIACAVSRLGDEWKVAVGARPKRAESILLDGRGKTAGQLAEEAAKAFSYGSNLRAGGVPTAPHPGPGVHKKIGGEAGGGELRWRSI